jgi:nitrate/nitrite-specific signal transduction histidine kinase
MTKFYTNLLFISLFAIGITVVIGYFSSKTLTKSITTLSKATQKIGEGDFDFQIAVTSKDEIGELGKSFEIMKQSLKQTQMKLLDSQNHLEKRVEERTEDLQQKIDELKNYKRLTVNRELKMVELKKEINRLHENLRYNAAEESKKQEKI